MSPSLKEKFNEIFPPDSRYDAVHLSDMIKMILILKPSKHGVRGDPVEITGVDPEKNEHTYKIDGGQGPEVRANNDADIYK